MIFSGSLDVRLQGLEFKGLTGLLENLYAEKTSHFAGQTTHHKGEVGGP